MLLGSWRKFGLIRSKNKQNERNGDSLDAFELRIKFHHRNCIVLFIGIILKNRIQIYILPLKSKSIYTIICG